TAQAEREACARLMASTDPWLTLGRDFEASLRLVEDPGRESHVAVRDGEVVGFLVLITHGALVGYIQSVGVAPQERGRGIGTELVGFAERRLFAEFPNVFLCVSSFNDGARRLYHRLGYLEVGELTDFILRGSSEILMRKVRGG